MVSRKKTWGKVFKSGLRKFCGRQPLKNLKRLSSTKFTQSTLEYFVPSKEFMVFNLISVVYVREKCISLKILRDTKKYRNILLNSLLKLSRLVTMLDIFRHVFIHFLEFCLESLFQQFFDQQYYISIWPLFFKYSMGTRELFVYTNFP